MHLRPVQFVDTPVGLEDGSALRLAGGMQWFAAYEVATAQAAASSPSRGSPRNWVAPPAPRRCTPPSPRPVRPGSWASARFASTSHRSRRS